MACYCRCSLAFSQSDIVGSIVYLVLDLRARVVLQADIVPFILTEAQLAVVLRIDIGENGKMAAQT